MKDATLVHRPTPPLDAASNGAVVVLVFGRLVHVGPCLAAVRRNLPAGVAVVLVDNGSPRDLTPELVRIAPDAHILRAHRSRGYAAGNNFGAAHAVALGAPLLYFLNDDTEVEPGFWEACAAACRDGAAGIAGSLLVHHDRPGVVQFAGLRCDLGRLRDDYRPADVPLAPEHRASWPCDAIFGAGFMMRSDLFRSLGGFDESYFHLFEEIDLCLRARAAGASVVLAGASVVRHKGGATLGYDRPGYVFHFNRNRLWMWRRLAAPRVFWTLAARRMGTQIASQWRDTRGSSTRWPCLAAALAGILIGFVSWKSRRLPLDRAAPVEALSRESEGGGAVRTVRSGQ